MTVACPVGTCRSPNDAGAQVCDRCGTPLRAYVQLATAAAQLFNRGLRAARDGDAPLARDLFAAVVHWCPMDLEARNALASACFMLRDFCAARGHWEAVLQRSPGDPIAQRGVAAVAAGPADAGVSRRSSKKQGRRRRRAR